MNLNEVNIDGLEDVYNTLKKASKANVQGLSGNTALGKNLVLKVLTALNDGKCDYNSAIDAIENIFIYGTKKEIRTNKPEYQDELENESLKVRKALNILKENGYIVNESADAYYVCFELYGDRAHSDPEDCRIDAVTTNADMAVKALMQIADAGPSDIWNFGVAFVPADVAEEYKQYMSGDNLVDEMPDAIPSVIKLTTDYPNVEYNGDSVCEICGYPDDYNDPKILKQLKRKFLLDVIRLI